MLCFHDDENAKSEGARVVGEAWKRVHFQQTGILCPTLSGYFHVHKRWQRKKTITISAVSKIKWTSMNNLPFFICDIYLWRSLKPTAKYCCKGYFRRKYSLRLYIWTLQNRIMTTVAFIESWITNSTVEEKDSNWKGSSTEESFNSIRR